MLFDWWLLLYCFRWFYVGLLFLVVVKFGCWCELELFLFELVYTCFSFFLGADLLVETGNYWPKTVQNWVRAAMLANIHCFNYLIYFAKSNSQTKTTNKQIYSKLPNSIKIMHLLLCIFKTLSTNYMIFYNQNQLLSYYYYNHWWSMRTDK